MKQHGPSEGSEPWKMHILPPMCAITLKAAWSAGPKHVSTFLVFSNIEGSESRRVSTTSRDSDRLTSRSSGIGRKS